MPSFENILLAFGLLLLMSTLISKASDRFGVPVLLFFLIIGMLAGSEGVGGIYFDNPVLAKSLGVVALILILFSGGFDTAIKEIRHILVPGIILSTLGVLISTFIVAAATVYWLKLSWLEGLLLGGIISSTDAAAVFNVLRSSKTSLRGKLQPLIEFESGSNDPIAVLITITIISLMKDASHTAGHLLNTFVLNIVFGLMVGWLFGRGMILFINYSKLAFEGLYPTLMFSMIFLTYASADAIGGNGFLAVYLAGIITGNANLLHRKALKNFLEGFAWLMQITMFLALGLLVFPSHIVPVIGIGLLVSLILMFVARPLSVWICLSFTNFNWREKALISWVGLRGAVPIILATFPLLAGTPKADMIFNLVFFIVLTSILFQGTSVPLVAKWLKVDTLAKKKSYQPIELTDNNSLQAHLEDVIIPYGSNAHGKSIIETKFPSQSLIVLICRNELFFIPKGSTTLMEGDILWVLAGKNDLKKMHRIIGTLAS